MRSYNPLQNKNIDLKEIVKDFFNTDRFAPDSFFNFKKDLIDFFSQEKSFRKTHYTFWLLSVYSYWKNLDYISETEAEENLVEQIPDAVRLGFYVFDDFIYFLQRKFPFDKEMKLFYSKIREQILSSQVPIGLNNTEIKLSDLFKKITLISSFENNSMRVAEFIDETKKLLFRNAKDEFVSEYLVVDESEVTQNFIKLLDFFHTTEPEHIWPAVELEAYKIANDIDPVEEEIPIKWTNPELTLEEAMSIPEVRNLELPDKTLEMTLEKNILPQNEFLETNKLEEKKELEKELKINKELKTQLIKPTYLEIKNKIEQTFSKDENNEYHDLDAVLMALSKASEKYQDPKIAELYVFDQETGKFIWDI